MSWIPKISSILKTWVFKKRVLSFSSRHRRDPMACFYCPEMCRFSCPVAESLKTDAVTPRGKMSLLHLAELGHSDEKVAGGTENRLWILEQCSGCGRCTEFCKWEVDVGSNLRQERTRIFESLKANPPAASPQMPAASGHGAAAAGHGQASGNHGPKGAGRPALPALPPFDLPALLSQLSALSGKVLLAEPGRGEWWRKRLAAHPGELAIDSIVEVSLPAREWEWGKLPAAAVPAIGQALGRCTELWVESGEAGWLLIKGVKEEARSLRAPVRLVWQNYFIAFASLELPPGVSFHESYHLARLFPRLGISIPMYERGLMPFHHGWNMIDCGGEGYFRFAHPYHALEMGSRFLYDLAKDGREVRKIICQSLSCVEHLKTMTKTPVSYWLDELEEA